MKKPDLLSLRPCQYVLGMKEVEAKISRMRKLDKKELQKFCDDRVIPVVKGPKKELYVIDHHHFARACWELGVECYSVHVVEDMSDLSESEFWNKMTRRDWTYLHDQFGLGPHPPLALPADIRGMADDPYRSLVWAVIDAGGIQKDKIPFFEFKWSAFFRLNIPIRLHSKSDFTEATDLALKLATSKTSDHLPGFVGKKNKKESKNSSKKRK